MTNWYRFMLQLEDFDLFRVPPGKKVKLKEYDPGWDEVRDGAAPGKKITKADAEVLHKKELKALAREQELLYASGTHAVLIVLQGMDAAGKDGTIKHVMSGVNPQGCQVVSFKQPSAEELEHDFLWRCAKNLPERGRIGIFNRSHYEEVAVVKVHRELLDKQKLPPGKRGKKFWEGRYEDINAFEHHLTRNGTVILKFFLNMSKKEQKKRLCKRLDNSSKEWKFSTSDLAERTHWDEYVAAFEDAPWSHEYRVGAVVRHSRG